MSLGIHESAGPGGGAEECDASDRASIREQVHQAQQGAQSESGSGRMLGCVSPIQKCGAPARPHARLPAAIIRHGVCLPAAPSATQPHSREHAPCTHAQVSFSVQAACRTAAARSLWFPPSLHQHQRIINASTFHRPSSPPKQYRGASSRRLGWLRAPSASLTTRSPSTPLAGPARTRTTQRPHRARWCPR